MSRDRAKPKRQPLKKGLGYYRDEAGKWRWRVVAGNYRIVHASTQGYAREGGARRNAKLVRMALAARA
jgi:uncharacterized protein YegP (UPF0339 family)